MRAGDARRERAVRLALGAGRGRLAREAIADSLLIGGLGAIAGLAMANALLGLVRWLATGVPRIEQAALDLRVVGVAAAAALAWALLLGTATVWRLRATAADVRSADLSRGAARPACACSSSRRSRQRWSLRSVRGFCCVRSPIFTTSTADSARSV